MEENNWVNALDQQSLKYRKTKLHLFFITAAMGLVYAWTWRRHIRQIEGRGTKLARGESVPFLVVDMAELAEEKERILELAPVHWKQESRGWIVFRNSTQHPMTIEKLLPSCGCIMAQGAYEGRTVNSKEEVPVLLSFKAPVVTGSVRHSLNIAYCIQGRAERSMSHVADMRATIVPNYVVEPGTIEVGGLSGKAESVKAVLRVRPMANNKVLILDVISNHPSLTVASRPSNGDDIEYVATFWPSRHAVGVVGAYGPSTNLRIVLGVLNVALIQ